MLTAVQLVPPFIDLYAVVKDWLLKYGKTPGTVIKTPFMNEMAHQRELASAPPAVHVAPLSVERAVTVELAPTPPDMATQVKVALTKPHSKFVHSANGKV
jgi:hypothetical protein